MRVIALQNLATLVSDDEIRSYIPGLQAQFDEDFGPFYDVETKLMFVGKNDKIPAGAWPARFFDDADVAGALGYHDNDSGVPDAQIFVRVTKESGASLSVVAAHELLELRANPRIGRYALAEASLGGFRGDIAAIVPEEVADACEADEFAYKREGVLVSDFVLPWWFPGVNMQPGYEGRYSFTGAVKEPLSIDSRGGVHGLLKGGYIGIRTFRRPGDWTTVNAARGRNYSAAKAAEITEMIDEMLPPNKPHILLPDGTTQPLHEIPRGSRRAKVMRKLA